MIYDPFPRTPTSVARVKTCAFARVARPAMYGVAPSIDPKAPRVKRVKGKRGKTIKRIICK